MTLLGDSSERSRVRVLESRNISVVHSVFLLAVMGTESSIRAAQISQAHALRQLALLAVAAQPQGIPREFSLRATLSALAWLDGHESKVPR